MTDEPQPTREQVATDETYATTTDDLRHLPDVAPGGTLAMGTTARLGGVLSLLAEHECRHGRLAQQGAAIIALPTRTGRRPHEPVREAA